MKKTKIVPLRIPENLDAVATLRADLEHTDKATAMRQWLHDGAEQYVLTLLGNASISIGRAAELLGVSIYDVQIKAQANHLDLGPTAEQLELAREHGRKLSAARRR